MTKEIAAVATEANGTEGAGNPFVLPRVRTQPAVSDPAEGVHAERVPPRHRRRAQGMSQEQAGRAHAGLDHHVCRKRPVNDRLLRAGLLVVSAAGIGVASYLTYVHYRPAALICTGSGGCETVQDSKYAVLAGIPVAVLGLAAWIAALALTVWNSELARTLTAALALAGLAFAVTSSSCSSSSSTRSASGAWRTTSCWHHSSPRWRSSGSERGRRRHVSGAGRRARPGDGATSSAPGAGCPPGCDRGSPSGSRPSR